MNVDSKKHLNVKETMMNSALAQDYYSKLDGILQRELNEAKEIINANKNKVEALAQALCDRSKLDTGEMRIILDDDVNRAKR